MVKPKRNLRDEGKGKAKLRALGIFFGLLFVVVFIFLPRADTGEWKISTDGLLEYPIDRGRIDCQRTPMETGEDYVLEKVVFESKGLNIFGLLRMPKGIKNPPGIVLLPGAQVTKEGEQGLATALQRLGFASLSLDQRGHGETGGSVPGMGEDFLSFTQGVEPVQHKMVYDALRAVDCMRTFRDLDKDKIYIGGESMGGRFAIIAGAIDRSISGVLAVSTSGYRLPAGLSRDQQAFLASIDPNAYASMISPRKLVMIHSKNDNVIPIEDALATFERTKEPKAFYTIQEKTHGYNQEMDAYLAEELVKWK